MKKKSKKKTPPGSPKREFRDSLFRRIYGGKDERSRRWLLSLYNSLIGHNHTDTAGLEITTIDSAVYVTIRNDVSFLIDSQMSLYEHQSTVNPNMPLRGMMYFAQLYRENLLKRDKDLFSSKLVKIPSPRFIVFYNGLSEKPDMIKYRLSDAFDVADKSGEFEWTATVLNINKGHNLELLKKCDSLYNYSEFVGRVRANADAGLSLKDAVDEAVDFAIQNDFLEGFFREVKMELPNTLFFDLTQEDYDRHRRQEGIEEGEERKAIESATNLLRMNLGTPEQIAQAIGLPLEEVISLRDSLSAELEIEKSEKEQKEEK